MNLLLHEVSQGSELWVGHLWRVSWQVVLAVTIVWIVIRALKPSARVECWLWRLACVKLLVLLVAVPHLSLPWLAPVEPAEIGPATASTAAATDNPAVSIEIEPAAQAQPPASQAVGQWLFPSLAAAWLWGAAAAVAATVRQAMAARRLVGASAPADATLQSVCDQEACRLGTARPAVLLAPGRHGPLLAGFWRPAIVLPCDYRAALDDEALRMVMRHELVHLKRRDLLWNLLPTVIGWPLFFHPLVWLLSRRWLAAQEAACDQYLVEHRLAPRADYARLLVRLAVRWPQTAGSLVASGISGTLATLERRLADLAHGVAPSRAQLVAWSLAIAALVPAAIVPWRLVAAAAPEASAAPTKVEVSISQNGDKDDTAEDKAAPEKTNPARPTVIVAEHVLLMEGRIVTWDEILARFRVLRKDGPLHPSFYVTNGRFANKTEGFEYWQKRIMEVYRELFQPAGVTYASCTPRTGRRLDAIRTADDLRPDPARAVTGLVLTAGGQPAAGAQVLVLPNEDVLDVSLAGTRLRNDLDEEWSPTDAAGRFTLHPAEASYFVAVLHADGFAMYRSPAAGEVLNVRLQPWVTLTLQTTGEVTGQTADVTSYPLGEDTRWPSFKLYSIETKGRPVSVRVPPGRVVLARSLATEGGSSISSPVETMLLEAGAKRELSLAPPTDADRAKADAVRRHIDSLRSKK